jgi:hypothetical protein
VKQSGWERGAAQHNDSIRAQDVPPHLPRLPQTFTFKCRGRCNIPAYQVGEDPQFEPFAVCQRTSRPPHRPALSTNRTSALTIPSLIIGTILSRRIRSRFFVKALNSRL